MQMINENASPKILRTRQALIIELAIVFFYALILSLLSGLILLLSVKNGFSDSIARILFICFLFLELMFFLSNTPSIALIITNILLNPLIKQIDAKNWKIFQRIVESTCRSY